MPLASCTQARNLNAQLPCFTMMSCFSIRTTNWLFMPSRPTMAPNSVALPTILFRSIFLLMTFNTAAPKSVHPEPMAALNVLTAQYWMNSFESRFAKTSMKPLKPFSRTWIFGCYITTPKDPIVGIETEAKGRSTPC